MSSKLTQAIALCLLLIGSHVFAESPGCVLPAADGGVENPSSPSVKGIIESVESSKITLRGNKNSPISISEDTHLFTVYGGVVFRNQIMKGQHILVWYVNCGASQKHDAAVIVFCSKGTEPCPK